MPGPEAADGQEEDGRTWWKLLALFLGGTTFLVLGEGLFRAIFTLGPGAVSFYLGWKQYKKAQLVRNTPTSTIRSLAVGAAEVKGEAHPVDEPLRSPLTDRDVCLYEMTMSRTGEDGSGDGSDGKGGMSLRDHVAFTVDDGTGAVEVEPDGSSLDLEPDAKVKVPAGEDPPEALRDWFASDAHLEGNWFAAWSQEDGDEEGGFLSGLVPDPEQLEETLTTPSDKGRVFEEAVLEVGERAHVWGGAYRREDADHVENVRNLVVREHEGTGTFHVSDKPEATFARNALVTAALAVAMGSVFLVFGIVVLLSGMGIV